MLDLQSEIRRGAPKKTRTKTQNPLGNFGVGICVVSGVLALVAALQFPRFLAWGLFGLMGVYVFAVLLLTFFAGVSLKFSKKYSVSRAYVICSCVMLVAVMTFINVISTKAQLGTYATLGGYLNYGFSNITAGGAMFGVISFLVYNVFNGAVGAGIALGATFFVSLAFMATFIISKQGENKVIKRKPQSVQPQPKEMKFERDQKELNDIVEQRYQELIQKQGRTQINEQKSRLGLDTVMPSTTQKPIYASTVPVSEINNFVGDEITNISTQAARQFNDGLMYATNPITVAPVGQAYAPAYNPAPSYAPVQSYNPAPVYNPAPTFEPPTQTFTPEVENLLTEYDIENKSTPITFAPSPRLPRPPKVAAVAEGQTTMLGGTTMEKPKKAYKPKRYVRPTLDMIKTESTDLTNFVLEAERNKKFLNEKMQEFGVNATVTGYVVAPAVTRFEIGLQTGTSVRMVNRLESDLQMALGTDSIRVENVKGKPAIGIEIPNKFIGCVSVRDIMASKEWANFKGALKVAIGKNINDEIVIEDIAKMPHLLIAGSTGSGKSVCINTILTSLLYHADPADLKLLLVDMKRVELKTYNGLPHMLIPESIKKVEQAKNALRWMQEEMERRYETFEQYGGIKNIAQYQAMPQYIGGQLDRMPYIVMVIDEAASLVNSGKREVEDMINDLAAKGRAAGLHIILATQRPAADVITSNIKANFPYRIGFKTVSYGDSTTIIGTTGCEKLGGRGDMLLYKENDITRMQCACINDDEAYKIMTYIRENNECQFDTEIEDYILNGPPLQNAGAAGGFGDASPASRAQDPLFVPVLRYFVRDENVDRSCSVSSIQRKFHTGFGRAGGIIDQMEEMGFVSPEQGKKGRTVLMTREEFENLYGAN